MISSRGRKRPCASAKRLSAEGRYRTIPQEDKDERHNEGNDESLHDLV
jgi:hypothetical protein